MDLCGYSLSNNHMQATSENLVIKIFMALILVILLTSAAWAQEQSPSDSEMEPSAVESQDNKQAADAADGATDNAAVVDDSDLDEQGYEDDDDDFIPTEEIPVDEPIPFPSNI